MSYLRRSVIGLAMVCAIAATTVSGQQSAAPPARPEYLIEYHTTDGCLFAPIVAPANRGSLLHALGRPDKYLPDSSGQPILSKIAVHAEQVGGLWSLKVFAGVGEFYDAGERNIASFKLRTNERADVTEAARLGLNPFSVAVVKVLGQAASKPEVATFKTPSISVDKLEMNTLPEPYHLFLKNNSDKDVLAIQYNTYKDGRFLHLKWLQLPHPQPLIKSGATYRFDVLSEDRACGDAAGYRPLQSDKIEVASVVFVDGSYEGDSGLAALIRGRAMGNKKNLNRAIAMLGYLNGNEESLPDLLLYHLRSLSEGMDEVAEPHMTDALRKSLPAEGNYSMSALTNFIRSGQHEIKTSLRADALTLEILIKSQNPKALKAWCATTIEKYTRWHAMAEAVSGH